ncbi:MAG: hypothetical protein AB7K52_00675 [Phycisphaerales bacterium]
MSESTPPPRSNVVVLSNVAVRDGSRTVLGDEAFRKHLRGRELLRKVAYMAHDAIQMLPLERRQASWMTEAQWKDYQFLPCKCGRKDFGKLPPDGRRHDYMPCRCTRS